MEDLTALEIAMVEDKYGTRFVDLILESPQYKEDFANWIRQIEDESKEMK